jgi:hypothetical protein
MKTNIIIKITILLLAFFNLPLAAIILTLNAHFHFTAPIEHLKKSSPDWIIFKIFGLPGFNTKIHHLIGIFLFLATWIWISSHTGSLNLRSTDQLFSVLVTTKLIIMISALIIQNYFKSGQSVSFF